MLDIRSTFLVLGIFQSTSIINYSSPIFCYFLATLGFGFEATTTKGNTRSKWGRWQCRFWSCCRVLPPGSP